MEKMTLTLSWRVIALILLGLGACWSGREMAWYKSAGKEPADIHTSRISLDWNGEYAGIIPSDYGPDVNVSITLNLDETFTLRYSRVDSPEMIIAHTGKFKWDKYEEIITLKIKNWPPYYKLSSYTLLMLDSNGRYIEGDLADRYVLKKIGN